MSLVPLTYFWLIHFNVTELIISTDVLQNLVKLYSILNLFLHHPICIPYSSSEHMDSSLTILNCNINWTNLIPTWFEFLVKTKKNSQKSFVIFLRFFIAVFACLYHLYAIWLFFYHLWNKKNSLIQLVKFYEGSKFYFMYPCYIN